VGGIHGWPQVKVSKENWSELFVGRDTEEPLGLSPDILRVTSPRGSVFDPTPPAPDPEKSRILPTCCVVIGSS